MRYAFFPAANRLVIDDNGAVSMYDTGDAYLTGISQQQSTTQTLSFSSTAGPVPLSRFNITVRDRGDRSRPEADMAVFQGATAYLPERPLTSTRRAPSPIWGLTLTDGQVYVASGGL